MMRKKLWITVCALLLAANIAFVWGNSMLPGSASEQLSGGLMSWIGFLFSAFGEYGEKILRKIAHLAEFGSLGFLLAALFRLFGKRELSLPVLSGLLVACVDETIQIFSPNRASSLLDVWIDMAGLTAGIILLLIGILIWKKRTANKPLEDKS